MSSPTSPQRVGDGRYYVLHGTPGHELHPLAETCSSCLSDRLDEALRAKARAEAMTGRLLSLLALSEAREARQRTEIGDLEQRLTRHAPKWEAESA